MSSLSEMKFLTVAEVAALMRVSKMTVYRLVHSGELPAVRVGRSFRVPEDADLRSGARDDALAHAEEGVLEAEVGQEREPPLSLRLPW